MSLIPNSMRYPIISNTIQTTVDDSNCKSIKDGCMATHRMINALIYYSTLNIDLNCHKLHTKSNKIHSITETNCIQLIDDLIMIFKDGKESNIKQTTDKDKFIKYITET
eukprot:148918_1